MKAMAPAPALKSCAGFSLIELAVVLMIVGMLTSGVLVAVTQAMANARVTDAQAQMREISEALYGFAEAYGRLPCPATSNNFEDPACNEMHGFVPSGSLGLTGPLNADGLLVDPWGNPFRYSVIIDEATGSPDFTSRSSIQIFFNMGTTLASGDMFEVCDDSACTQTFSNTVPAVVLSMGANFGDYSSPDEIMNAGDQTLNGYPIKDDYRFVSANFSAENFDDQLIWLSPYILFNRLVSAGKLP